MLGDKTEATVWLNGKRYEADLAYREGRHSEAQKKSYQPARDHNLSNVISAALNSSDNRSIVEALNEPDLAVLKIRTPDRPFIPASFSLSPQYRMGQDVYTIGFPLSHILGDQPRLNKGLLSATVGVKDHPDFVQISAEIQPGNSGGPLLNDQGQVIGMVQMTLDAVKMLTETGTTPQNVNFAIKNTRIRQFLQRSGEAARILLRESDVVPFDEVQQSLLLVHAGIVPENFKQVPKLVCTVSYVYLWDLWFRFQMLDVVFFDFDTQEALLRTGQYGDNPFSTEDGTLDQVFNDIHAKMGR